MVELSSIDLIRNYSDSCRKSNSPHPLAPSPSREKGNRTQVLAPLPLWERGWGEGSLSSYPDSIELKDNEFDTVARFGENSQHPVQPPYLHLHPKFMRLDL